MRDRLDVLTCDHPGCGAQVVGPASRLTRLAREAGWQVSEAVHVDLDSEEGPEVARTDLCPTHPTQVMDRDQVRRMTGAPPGAL